MPNDSEQDTVVKELRLYGIKPSIEKTHGNHIAISWRVAPDKPLRTITVASTGSDFRGRLNMRAETRRYLKADNAQIPMVSKKINERIFELPKPQELDPVPNQLAQLRDDLSDMASLLMSMVESIELINANATNQRFVVDVVVRQVTGTEPPVEEKKKTDTDTQPPAPARKRKEGVVSEILNILNTPMTQVQIAQATGRPDTSIHNAISRMSEDGLIKKNKAGRGALYSKVIK